MLAWPKSLLRWPPIAARDAWGALLVVALVWGMAIGGPVAMAQQSPEESETEESASVESGQVPFELRPFRNWLATHAQRAATIDGPIQTDRPSFTAAPTLVPRGWAQLESGYQFTYNRQADRTTNSNSGPQLNLRLGLLDWLEFRNLWSGVQTSVDRDRNSGFDELSTTSANLETGFKIRISEEHGWIPQSALITSMYLPTGHGGNPSRTVDPGLDYIYIWTLAEHFSLTGSTGAVFAGRRSQHSEWFQSVVLGGDWSDKWSSYLEWYITGNQAASRPTSGQTMDVGILWRPRSNIQFDWRAGHGMAGTADDFFTGVGFSGRY